MLSSVLLHLNHAAEADPVIRLGVELARSSTARVRGLTLCDTRPTEAAIRCETAAYAVMEQSHQARTEIKQQSISVQLSRACLEAGLNFDVRRLSGDPLHVLPQEARYHDLTISSIHRPAGTDCHESPLSLADVRLLLLRGVQPLVVVHSGQQEVQRVLLAFDGSEASGRAIRSFVNHRIFPHADCRLLSIGRAEADARQALGEMADYCSSRMAALETGLTSGPVPRVLPAYARKWQADLVVLGICNDPGWLGQLRGRRAMHWLKSLPCSAYIVT